MAMLTFYRQARADGGVRTGIDLDDVSLGQWFEPGPEDDDNRLLWYVDLRFVGESLPSTFEEARDWLIRNGTVIGMELKEAKDQLSVGFDTELKPYSQRLGDLPGGVQFSIYCSAVRRLQARDIQPELQAIIDHWQEWLHRLEPATEFAS